MKPKEKEKLEILEEEWAGVDALTMLDNLAHSTIGEKLELEADRLIETNLLYSTVPETRILKRKISGFQYLRRLLLPHGDVKKYCGAPALDTAKFSVELQLCDLLL